MQCLRGNTGHRTSFRSSFDPSLRRMWKVLSLILPIVSMSAQAQVKETLYVGTYSVRGSEGIYALEFDPVAISLKILHTAVGLGSPTYITIHPTGQFLFSANRAGINGATNEGSVSAFSIQADGRLTLINNQRAFGLSPCHIAIDESGKSMLVAQFAAGTLAAYSILPDGSVSAIRDSTRYEGHGTHPTRQEAPHIHFTARLPRSRFALVTDLGTDKIYCYDISSGFQFATALRSTAAVMAGAGPRHIVFHPHGNYFYVVEEITSTLAIFKFDDNTGDMKLIEDGIQTLPAGFHGENSGADIHISPDGKFLYTSNRGANSLAIFSILKNGKLKLIGQQDTFGKIPRFFMMNESGDFLFVANQDSDNVVVFKRNRKTGLLQATGIDLKIPSPVCIQFLPASAQHP
jgi:6-phosphogluconolactonase